MLNLRILRESKKLTQKDMAEILQVSKPTYCHYETGRYEPDLKTIFRLADYFGVSIDYLLGHQTKDTIWTDGMNEQQKKLVEIVSMLTPAQANFALGYFSDMLGLTYSHVKPTRPF